MALFCIDRVGDGRRPSRWRSAVEGSVASDHVQMPVLMIHRQAKMASGHPVGGEDSDYRGASGTPPPTGYGRTDCHGTMWQLSAIFLHFPLLSDTFRDYTPQIGFPLSPALLCCKICFYSNGIPRKTAGTIHKCKTKPGRPTNVIKIKKYVILRNEVTKNLCAILLQRFLACARNDILLCLA